MCLYARLLILMELIDLVNSAIISSDLTQMINVPSPISDCVSLSCSFEFLFSGASIYVLQWISLQWEIQIMLYQFLVSPHRPSKSDYSCADWDGLRDHLRDVPWEDIFKLSAFAAANYESFKV